MNNTQKINIIAKCKAYCPIDSLNKKCILIPWNYSNDTWQNIYGLQIYENPTDLVLQTLNNSSQELINDDREYWAKRVFDDFDFEDGSKVLFSLNLDRIRLQKQVKKYCALDHLHSLFTFGYGFNGGSNDSYNWAVIDVVNIMPLFEMKWILAYNQIIQDLLTHSSLCNDNLQYIVDYMGEWIPGVFYSIVKIDKINLQSRFKEKEDISKYVVEDEYQLTGKRKWSDVDL